MWRRRRRVVILAGVALVMLAVAVPLGRAATDRYYLPRVLLWMDADVGDHERFPSRAVGAGPSPFEYPVADGGTSSDARLQTVTLERDGQREERPLDDVLTSTGTTAFLVIHADHLVSERYFDGYDRESTQTSFSVAKSFVSALVGIAIEAGHIGGVDDPITTYLPELLDRDPRFGRITIRHLLTMSSGIRYDESGLPWDADDTKTYYMPDLRALALACEIESEPGQRFEYNNYNPLLLGLILERATGMSVSAYLAEKVWQPLGMGADGSWSLDSTASGFEKMESGINGRAIDFAKFGSLYLHGGEWGGRQVVPQAWVEESTRADVSTDPARGYQYFWWVGEAGHYSARGNHGQYIFVAPEKDLVIVRFGTRYGHASRVWMDVFEQVTARFEAPSGDGLVRAEFSSDARGEATGLAPAPARQAVLPRLPSPSRRGHAARPESRPYRRRTPCVQGEVRPLAMTPPPRRPSCPSFCIRVPGRVEPVLHPPDARRAHSARGGWPGKSAVRWPRSTRPGPAARS